jgi:SpoVK/Ycf46/Vps4 family AAA+-type ATPase
MGLEACVATGEQLKALIRSYGAGDEERFRSIAMQIAAHAARNGQIKLAKELQQLLENAPVGADRGATEIAPVLLPLARPAGELAGLVTASYPKVRLSAMVLTEEMRGHLSHVLEEYRHRELLRSHGFQPRRKLLLVGPPGCGKTMTAAALAGELGLPLLLVQLHGLITKFMGETAAKLSSVFDAMKQTRGAYFFDEFDAIGSHRGAENDVGEIRRVLNSFLQFLEQDQSDSLVIAATNFVDMLDEALFRRFDDVLHYDLPTPEMVRRLVENRISLFSSGTLDWDRVTQAAAGLNHADVIRGAEDAAKKAILAGHNEVGTAALITSLSRRPRPKPRNLAGIPRNKRSPKGHKGRKE